MTVFQNVILLSYSQANDTLGIGS